jgi:hypothetical protein
LCGDCLLKHVTEGKIEGVIRQGRRCKQLLDDPKEKRRYWKVKEEALNPTVWRTCCGRVYGPVVGPTMGSINSESRSDRRIETTQREA